MTVDPFDLPIPQEDYVLDHFPATPYEAAKTYVHAPASPWQILLDRRPEGTVLKLILGDMGYHDISLWEIEGSDAAVRRTAETYDETGAADDIEQILLAARRLCGTPRNEGLAEAQKAVSDGVWDEA